MEHTNTMFDNGSDGNVISANVVRLEECIPQSVLNINDSKGNPILPLPINTLQYILNTIAENCFNERTSRKRHILTETAVYVPKRQLWPKTQILSQK